MAHFGAAWPTPADVLIPLSTTFERSGSFSNFEGTESRFEAVFDKGEYAAAYSGFEGRSDGVALADWLVDRAEETAPAVQKLARLLDG